MALAIIHIHSKSVFPLVFGLKFLTTHIFGCFPSITERKKHVAKWVFGLFSLHWKDFLHNSSFSFCQYCIVPTFQKKRRDEYKKPFFCCIPNEMSCNASVFWSIISLTEEKDKLYFLHLSPPLVSELQTFYLTSVAFLLPLCCCTLAFKKSPQSTRLRS